jgi:hypothetical protein
MDSIQAAMNIQRDALALDDTRASLGWLVRPWPLEATSFTVTIRSRLDNEEYVFKFEWSDYPEGPPSIRCVDPATQSHAVRAAWPQCDGFRPPPEADLCLNISREGFALHPDWNRDAVRRWNPAGNPLASVLHTLQDRLNDRTKYHGRHT